MKRLDEKLARIRAGQYRRQDFIIADAKDPDMGPSLTWTGPKREPDGSFTRYRTRDEFLDQIRAVVRQGIVDIMLMSASNMERLTAEGLFADSPVKAAIRANDTSDIWRMRGAAYHDEPSRPFRSASIPRTMFGTVVAAVARRLVPKCSAAMVTNNAQNPVANPISIHMAYMPVAVPFSWKK